jgi:hypothetical protein
MPNLKAKKGHEMHPYRDAIAKKIAEKTNRLQHKIVQLLQQWDRRSSVKQKKAVLLLFCLGCSTCCSYMFFHALSGKANMAISFGHIPPLTKPPPSRRGKDSTQRIIK